MLTETLSGRCPCCNYTKLLQRYGSQGYLQMDGCPRCGFGYAFNHHDPESFGVEAWLDYGIHILACNRINDYEEDGYQKELERLSALSPIEQRRAVFEWAEKQTKYEEENVDTVFLYTKEDIIRHRMTNPVIFPYEAQKNK